MPARGVSRRELGFGLRCCSRLPEPPDGSSAAARVVLHSPALWQLLLTAQAAVRAPPNQLIAGKKAKRCCRSALAKGF